MQQSHIPITPTPSEPPLVREMRTTAQYLVDLLQLPIGAWKCYHKSNGGFILQATAADGLAAIRIERIPLQRHRSRRPTIAKRVETRRNQVKKLHNKGRTQKAIALQLAVSQKTVSADLKAMKMA